MARKKALESHLLMAVFLTQCPRSFPEIPAPSLIVIPTLVLPLFRRFAFAAVFEGGYFSGSDFYADILLCMYSSTYMRARIGMYFCRLLPTLQAGPSLNKCFSGVYSES